MREVEAFAVTSGERTGHSASRICTHASALAISAPNAVGHLTRATRPSPNTARTVTLRLNALVDPGAARICPPSIVPTGRPPRLSGASRSIRAWPRRYRSVPSRYVRSRTLDRAPHQPPLTRLPKPTTGSSHQVSAVRPCAVRQSQIRCHQIMKQSPPGARPPRRLGTPWSGGSRSNGGNRYSDTRDVTKVRNVWAQSRHKSGSDHRVRLGQPSYGSAQLR